MFWKTVGPWALLVVGTIIAVVAVAFGFIGCAQTPAVDPTAERFGVALLGCIQSAETREEADACRARVEARFDGGKE